MDQNELINITPIVSAVLSLCFAVITVFAIPWIRSKIKLNTVEMEETELEKIWKWVDIAVRAAEQLADQGRIPKSGKYQYVVNILAKHGFKLDEQDIEVLIEGFCRDLPKWLIEGATNESQNPDDGESEIDELMDALAEEFSDEDIKDAVEEAVSVIDTDDISDIIKEAATEAMTEVMEEITGSSN